ncbi:MAG: sulfatase-like hydrolase/transferase [Prolixibacteraceae bacterium]|nr:sulfatase-like hydrolase/transferase [Prolixibacteraceae bacterium]MBT6006776.1 sulfatase-like hydrolase/transferase [Prolixibacteraceae bacterium]MBT6764348.1 sulfatase-like hydrolase/transferase [Prolixibacteraceae bacterium]MBT7396315.1 sulfatase-like hydrolase/transferase [Prolixibacteraceae bacterium]
MSKIRNRFIGFTAIGFSVLLLFSVSCNNQKTAKTEDKQPNIVVIIADDLGWNDVGYHGSEIKTPTIDKLARSGIEFDRFYVCSVCSPTRASLLTGRYPSRYGILSPLGDEAGLPTGTVTIAGLLQQNGYDTGISGKWHLGTVPEGRPLNYGFNSSYGYLRGQIDPYTHLYKDGSKTWHRNDVLEDEEGHATDLITEEAIRFISKPREKSTPFFLYVAYSVPHYPLEEPKEWTDIYEQTISNESRRKNAASVTHMDNSIEQILQVLRKTGVEENTIVMFLSDNGGQKSWSSKTQYNGKFKPHDVLGDNRPLRDWKTSFYDGALRVPAVLIWPAKIKHMKIDESINVADIYPTLAFLAGAEIPDELNLEGFNFWPAVEGESLSKERIMFWRSNNASALKKGNWKLVHKGKNFEEGTVELYNLHSDPYETQDVSKENIEKVLELKKDLKRELELDSQGILIGAS